MTSSGMLRRVALVRTDVSEKLSASIIRVTRIGELGTMLAATGHRRLLVMANVPSSSILVILMMEALSSSETWVLTRAIRHNIPEDAILQSHRRENLKSYTIRSSYLFSMVTQQCHYSFKYLHQHISCSSKKYVTIKMYIESMMCSLRHYSVST
jgi:hypothetical protein